MLLVYYFAIERMKKAYRVIVLNNMYSHYTEHKPTSNSKKNNHNVLVSQIKSISFPTLMSPRTTFYFYFLLCFFFCYRWKFNR